VDHVDASSGGSDPEDPVVEIRPPPGLEASHEGDDEEEDVNVLCYGPHGSPKRRLQWSSDATRFGTDDSVFAYGPQGSPKRHQQAPGVTLENVLAYGPHGSPKRPTHSKGNLLQPQKHDSPRRRAARQAAMATLTAAAEARGVHVDEDEPIFAYGPHGSPKKSHRMKNPLAQQATQATTKRVAGPPEAHVRGAPMKVALPGMLAPDQQDLPKEILKDIPAAPTHAPKILPKEGSGEALQRAQKGPEFKPKVPPPSAAPPSAPSKRFPPPTLPPPAPPAQKLPPAPARPAHLAAPPAVSPTGVTQQAAARLPPPPTEAPSLAELGLAARRMPLTTDAPAAPALFLSTSPC
jgi:hypothetical protein